MNDRLDFTLSYILLKNGPFMSVNCFILRLEYYL